MTSLQVLQHPSWFIGAISQQAPNKALENTPCEDASKTGSVNDTVWLIGADGVGSSKHSEEGAQAAIREADDYLIELFTGSGRDHFNTLHLNILFETAHQRLMTLARRRKETPLAFATTLQAAIIHNDTLYYARLGDGGATALLTDTTSFLGPVPSPGNVTHSLHQSDWHKHFHTQTCSIENLIGVALFTDGAENWFIQPTSDDGLVPSTSFFDSLLPFLTSVGNFHFARALIQFATDDRLVDDDRTIATLISKERISANYSKQ